MTEMTTYAPGTPNWVELSSPDIYASIDFYAALFGWEVPEPGSPDGYRRALLAGKPTAGMLPIVREGQPPAWRTYVTVEDADATAAAVLEVRGQVIAEPMDVMDLGRMAVFIDTEGAVFAVWQPGSFAGAEIVSRPDAYSWNKLFSRDPERAKDFYAAVFRWIAVDLELEDGGTYTTWLPSGSTEVGDSVCSMLDMRGRAPDDVPPHWLVYFMVEDRDAALARAKESGGRELASLELPGKRLAILADPHGAMFAIFEWTWTG